MEQTMKGEFLQKRVFTIEMGEKLPLERQPLGILICKHLDPK